jgi:hypothetical protein
VRDGRYLLLAVIAPVGSYLLFSAVFGSTPGPNTTFGLPAAKEIMVAMATFGAMWAALSATAPRLARDREGGWSDYLATTPLRAGQVLVGLIAAGMIVALPFVALGIASLADSTVAFALSTGLWVPREPLARPSPPRHRAAVVQPGGTRLARHQRHRPHRGEPRSAGRLDRRARATSRRRPLRDAAIPARHPAIPASRQR